MLCSGRSDPIKQLWMLPSGVSELRPACLHTCVSSHPSPTFPFLSCVAGIDSSPCQKHSHTGSPGISAKIGKTLKRYGQILLKFSLCSPVLNRNGDRVSGEVEENTFIALPGRRALASWWPGLSALPWKRASVGRVWSSLGTSIWLVMRKQGSAPSTSASNWSDVYMFVSRRQLIYLVRVSGSAKQLQKTWLKTIQNMALEEELKVLFCLMAFFFFFFCYLTLSFLSAFSHCSD